MSKIPYSFTPVPNFLIDNGWTDDPKTWKLIRNLFRRTRTEGHSEFIEGREIYLEPFEFIFGRKRTALETGLSENEIRKRIDKFLDAGITSRITSKSTSNFTVYKWVTEAFEENWHQQKHQQNNQQKHQQSNQPRAGKSTTKYIEELRDKIKEPPSAEVVKTKDLIGDGLFKLGISKEEADKLFKTWGAEIVFLAYQHITADGFTIETTPIQAMKFACKNKPWEWKTNKPTPESHRQKFTQHFEDGKFYNGYQLQLSPTGFVFFSGLTSDGAKFDDPHFSAQMSRVLKRFGIQHPTQIDFKAIKEA